MSATGLSVFRCRQCQAVYFPRRSLCATCGASEFDDIDGSQGRIEQSTVVRHRAGAGSEGGAQHLATVLTTAGPRVIVALQGPLADGTVVTVSEHEGLLLASPRDRA